MRPLRILKLVGPYAPDSPKTHTYESVLGPVTEYRYRIAYGMDRDKIWFWNWNVLDSHYKQGDPQLNSVYSEITELAEQHDIIYHDVGDMMHPEFIKTLSKSRGGPIYTIYCVDGEPASSAILSHPVVWAYDFALTCSKMYDYHRSCVQMLLENKAYGASWVACGTKYPLSHSAWDIPIDADRDIDVIFLGANMEYMTKSNDKYPPNKYKAIEYLRSRGLNVHCEAWQNIDHAAGLYRRTKVGLSLHGPSPFGVGNSQRLYDLTVCGVPVVTDGATLGIDEIFEQDEVSAFIWTNFEEMYSRIRWMLEHKESRLQMAAKARERTKKYYRNDKDDNWMLRGINLAIDYWKQKGIWTL